MAAVHDQQSQPGFYAAEAPAAHTINQPDSESSTDGLYLAAHLTLSWHPSGNHNMHCRSSWYNSWAIQTLGHVC